MKKFLIIVVTLICVFSCTLTFACSNSIYGTYKFCSAIVNGSTFSAGEKRNGVIISEDYFTIKIENNWTFEMDSPMMAGKETGVLIGKGNNVYLFVDDIDGSKIYSVISGGTLVVIVEDNVLVLKK
ncbi:MAG: hypothetical protein J5697_04230 [Clostridia bacterium]|nr:hypothetical protein [Clostridia bacterium]